MNDKIYNYIDDLIENNSYEIYRNATASKELVVNVEDIERIAKQHFGNRLTNKQKARNKKHEKEFIEGVIKMLIDIYGKDGSIPYVKRLIGAEIGTKDKKE